MTCDNCENKEAIRLIYGPDGQRCDKCHAGRPAGFNPNYHVRGNNKFNKKMTEMDIRHVKSRYIGKDGRVHAHPRYETRYF